MRTKRYIGIVMLVAMVSAVQVGSTTVTRGAAPTKLVITDIDTTRYPDVDVYLAAPDGDLPDTRKLQIAEDGQQITPKGADTANVGVAVAFVISLRRSMRGQGLPGSSRLKDAREMIGDITLALNSNVDQISVLGFHKHVVPISATQMLTDGGRVRNVLYNYNTLPDQLRDLDPMAFASSDEHAYSALSSAILSATRELSATTSIGQSGAPQNAVADKLRKQLKLIVVFADSCDDLDPDLKKPNDQSCAVPPEVDQELQAQAGKLTIIAVGVGSDSKQQTKPALPDNGYSYIANYSLLRQYAGNHFFQLYTPDAQQAQAKRKEIEQAVNKLITSRRNQLVVTYTSHVRGGMHDLAVTNDGQKLRRTFTEPVITPTIELIANPQNTGLQTIVTNNQSPIVGATYFRNNIPVGEKKKTPFEISQEEMKLQPNDNTITVNVVLQDGRTFSAPQVAKIKGKSAPLEPSPTPNNPVQPSPSSSSSWLLYAIFVLALVALAMIIALWLARRQSQTSFSSTQQLPPVLYEAPQYALATLPDRKTVYPLRSSETIIGSKRDATDITLTSLDVAEQHTIITTRGDGRLDVIDKGSPGGTFINNVRLPREKPSLLIDGDLLTFGRTTLKCIRWSAAEQRTMPETPGAPAAPQPDPMAAHEASV